MLKTAYVKVLLIAKHDGELLQKHLQDIEESNKDLHLLLNFFLELLLTHTRRRWALHSTTYPFSVFQNLLRYNQWTNIGVFSEVNYDFIARNPDTHVACPSVCDNKA